VRNFTDTSWQEQVTFRWDGKCIWNVF